jgi:GAF domain-containing protein
VRYNEEPLIDSLKDPMERGFTLRTYLWLAGSLFILAACLCFLAYLLLPIPWWGMVLALGLLIAGVVELLEHALARPLERLSKGSGRTRDGLPTLPPPPAGWLKAFELTRLWKGMRAYHEHLAQARRANQALEAQVKALRAQVRMVANASQALAADVTVEQVAPWVLRELGASLGLSELYLVPLRRHCPVGVLGGEQPPAWAEAMRSTGLTPWEDVLAQGRPVSLSLTGLAPAWRAHWGHGALWVAPLNYCGKSQGLLLAPAGMVRTLTPDELNLVSTLARILACALHPPRWSDDRKPAVTVVNEVPAAPAPAETMAPEVPPETPTLVDTPVPADVEIEAPTAVAIEADTTAEAATDLETAGEPDAETSPEAVAPQPDTPVTMPPAERTDRRRRRRQKKGA